MDKMIDCNRDVIYGRKHGLALTLDVHQPRDNGNGIGLVFIASGGWYSGKELADYLTPQFIEPAVLRGYMVFVVVLSSRPRFTIPEMREDVQRAIRFVRYHAKEYSIDASRLGLYGLSAGGHLSLLAALTSDDGDKESEDVYGRESCAVQAIAEFYAPTDFFNYGATGVNAVGQGLLSNFKSAFDFCELDPETNCYLRISDAARVDEIAAWCSPINHLSKDSPPIFIIHGDADEVVPVQQSQAFKERAQQVGASVELGVVPAVGHGWEDMAEEMSQVIEWFGCLQQLPKVCKAQSE